MDTESQSKNSNSEDFETSFSESDTSESSSSGSNNSPYLQLGHLSQLCDPVIAQEAPLTPSETNHHHITKTLTELDNHCEVCYSSVSPDFLQEDCKHLFEIIYCKECHTPAHLICYGLGTPLEEEIYKGDRLIKVFHCDRCKEETNDQNLCCYICNSKEGCLRLTKDGKWMHVLCGIGSPFISFENLTNMSIDLSGFKKETNKLRSITKCELCKRKVETFKCVDENNTKHSHIHCALRDAYLDAKNNIWKIYFSIAHQEALPVHEDFDDQAVLANINDIAFGLRDIIAESGLSKKSYEPLLNIRARKAPKGYKGKKKLTKEDAQLTKFLNNVLKKAIQKAERNFLENVPKKALEKREEDEFAQEIGGKVILVNLVESADEFRLMELEEETKKDDHSKRELIKEFYKEIMSTDILYEVYSEDKIPKLRSDLADFICLDKLSFPEVLFFANVFQKRMRAACDGLCSLHDLKKLIESSKYLPFSLVGLVKELNEKYYTGVATDILLKPCIESCKPESAFDFEKRAFNREIIKKNRIAKDQTLEVQKLYFKESCGIITKLLEVAMIYCQQLIFLDEVYDQVKQYYDEIGVDDSVAKSEKKIENKQPPKALMVMLYGKINNLALLKGLGEIKLLEEFVEEPRINEGPQEIIHVEIEEEEEDIKENEEEEEEQPLEIEDKRNRVPKERYYGEPLEKEPKLKKEKKKDYKVIDSDESGQSEEEWVERSEGGSESVGFNKANIRTRSQRKTKENPTIEIKEKKEQNNNGVIKGKRGRKPKNLDSSTKSMDRDKFIMSSEDLNVKKRLRKLSKVSNKEFAESEEISWDDEGEKLFEEDDMREKLNKNINKVPNKRGRKKKVVIEARESSQSVGSAAELQERESGERNQQERIMIARPGLDNLNKTKASLHNKPFIITKISPSTSAKHNNYKKSQNKEEKESITKKASNSKKSVEEKVFIEKNIEEKEKEKGKRGRKPRSEKMDAEAEEEFKRDMKNLTEKISMEEAQKKLEGSTNVNSEDILENIKKVLDWKESYEDCIAKKTQNLKSLVDQIDELDIRIPEMAEALGQKKAWGLWKKKAYTLHRKLKKKAENIYDEKEEMVTIEEIEHILSEAAQMGYVEFEDGVYQDLGNKIINAKSIQEKFHAPEQEWVFDSLKETEKKIRSLNVRIPELSILKQKLEVNQNLQSMLEKPTTLEKLEDYLQKLADQTDIIDADLHSDLKDKVSEAKKVQEELRKYLVPAKEYKLEELYQLACVNKKARVNKVLMPELDETKALIESFILLANIYSILFDVQGLDLETIEAGDFLSFKDKSLVEIIFACEKQAKKDGLQSLSESKIEILRGICARFQKLVQKCNGNTLQDSIFSLIFKSISLVLEKLPASSKSINNSTMMEEKEDISEGLYDDRLKEWNREVRDFLRANPEETLTEILDGVGVEELDYDKVEEKLEELKKEAERLIEAFVNGLKEPQNLVSQSKKLQKILGWVEWATEAIIARRQVVEEKQHLEAKQLRRLGIKMERFKLPKSTSLCRIVMEWYKAFDNVSKALDKIYSVSVNDSPIRTRVGDTAKLRLKDIIEKTKKNKLSIEEMAHIKDMLKRIARIVKVGKDLRNIDRDIERYNSWANDVQDLGEEYLQYTEEELGMKDRVKKIKKGLLELKKEIWDLKVWQESEEITLRLLDWMLRASDMIRNEEKTADYDEWKEMLEEVKVFGEVEGDNGRVSKLKEEINKEIMKVEVLRDILRSLREGEKVSMMELKRVQERAMKCRVKIDEEQKIIDKICKDCELARIKAERVVGSWLEKSFLIDVRECLQKLRSLPVKFIEEEEKVNKALMLAESVKEEALKIEKQNSEGKRNIEEIEALIEKYTTCPVHVQEVEDIKSKLKHTKIGGDLSKIKKHSENSQNNWERSVDKKEKVRTEDTLKEKNRTDRLYSFDKESQKEKEQEREIEKKKDVIQRFISKDIPAASSKTSYLSLFKKDNQKSTESLKESLNMNSNKAEQKKRPESPKRMKIAQESFDIRIRDRSPPRTKFNTERNNVRKSSKEELKERRQSPKTKIVFEKNIPKKEKEEMKFPRDRHTMLAELKRLFESAEFLDFSLLECFENAKVILQNFPEILQKQDKYDEVVGRLEVLLKYEYITKSLVDHGFDKDYVNALISLDQNGINRMEQKIKENGIPSANAQENLELTGNENQTKHLEKKKVTFEEKNERSPDSYNFDKLEKIRGNKESPEQSQEKLMKPCATAVFSIIKKHEVSEQIVATPYRPAKEHSKIENIHSNDKIATASTSAYERFESSIKKKESNQKKEESHIAKRLAFDKFNIPNNRFEVNNEKGAVNHASERKSDTSEGLLSAEKTQEANHIQEHSILKIFEGSLKYPELNKEYQKVGFFTCDSISSVISIPQIPNKEQVLKLEGRISKSRFEAYLNQAFQQWEKKVEKIISGWVESPASNNCEQMAKDLLNVDKISMATYHESSKIFFLHKNQIPESWATKLSLRIRRIGRSSDPTLCFIVIHKPYKLRSPIKAIEPQLISSVQKDNEEGDDLAFVTPERFKNIFDVGSEGPKEKYGTGNRVYGDKQDSEKRLEINSKRSFEKMYGDEIKEKDPEKKVKPNQQDIDSKNLKSNIIEKKSLGSNEKTADQTTNNSDASLEKLKSNKEQELIKISQKEIEAEIQTINKENETKFSRLKASQTNIQKNIEEILPKHYERAEVILHNPIMRQKFKDEQNNEQLLKEDERLEKDSQKVGQKELNNKDVIFEDEQKEEAIESIWEEGEGEYKMKKKEQK